MLVGAVVVAAIGGAAVGVLVALATVHWFDHRG